MASMSTCTSCGLVLAGLGLWVSSRREDQKSNKRKVQAVIFDLDGTLIDFEGVSHVALEAPLARRGAKLPWELHGKIVGRKAEDWSAQILEELKMPKTVLKAEKYVQEYMNDLKVLYGTIQAWPGTLHLLRRLKEMEVPMAIATSSPRPSFNQKMEYHKEILKLMDVVVTGDEVKRGKPQPDIFLEAARRLGKDATKCLVFEDSALGIAGAQAAGSLTVALPDPRFPENARKLADLKPTWLLKDGIGQFDPEELELEI
ncbi:unnamed protein product [Cladocopium goreaui]|uniref:Uncharacterized protein n=1 Tax=Cladocopium goreaui TaxID=2562237 RepID=A0A9P1G4J1_9DINO|nr:unnamed protein product [Cladocopium goreaui]